MSSHRSRGAYAVDPRAAGYRRVLGATSVTALGGTALAVFFGSLFAQAFAGAAARPSPRPAAAAAALTVPEKSPENSAGTKHAPKPPAAAPQPAAGEPVASSGGS